MGRPRNDPTKSKVIAGIEKHCRSFFEGLGIRGKGVEEGLDYVRRGYTMEAAAKLVLAGGRTRAAFQGEEAA